MTEIYGQKWPREYGDTPLPAWEDAISELSNQQIRFGLKCCKTSGKEWPPSLPLFLEYCNPKPEDLGIPLLDPAFREACQAAAKLQYNGEHTFSHPVVQIAMRNSGTWNLTNLPSTDAMSIFRLQYECLVKRVLSGESLDFEAPKALPAKPAHRTSTAEEREAGVAMLRQRINRTTRPYSGGMDD